MARRYARWYARRCNHGREEGTGRTWFWRARSWGMCTDLKNWNSFINCVVLFRLPTLSRSTWMTNGSRTGTSSLGRVSDATLSMKGTDSCTSHSNKAKSPFWSTRRHEHDILVDSLIGDDYESTLRWRVTIIEYYKHVQKRGHFTSEMWTPSKWCEPWCEPRSEMKLNDIERSESLGW